jgi:hypothetical protein
MRARCNDAGGTLSQVAELNARCVGNQPVQYSHPEYLQLRAG